MIITELLAGLSMATKAAFGISMAAVGVTAGGAAGVLPGPTQAAVAITVEAVTPFSFPDAANTKADFGGTVATDGGVDGTTVSADAKLQGDANRPADTGSTAGRPTAPGQSGLDKANTTPAAGHAPTAVPTGKPATAGTQSSTGLDTASSTPAAGHVPTAIPSGSSATAGSQSTAGLSTASRTPAAAHLPARP